MTKNEIDLFLLSVMFICSVMCIFNLFRVKSRGVSSLLLAGAFLLFSVTIQLYRTGVSQNVLEGCTVALFALLVVDFLLRAGKPTDKKKGSQRNKR